MDEIVKKVKEDIETYLMDYEDNQEMRIEYILFNSKTKETQVLASDGLEDIILFAPYTKDNENGFMKVPEWDFNFDEYFFKELENNYEIGFINDETHYGLWISINDYFPEDIDYQDGVVKYLEYCKDNNITKEYLDSKSKQDTPDVIKNLEMNIGETFEYKGYIAEIDDLNYDNTNENLVHIYESKEDFEKSEETETVSLKSINIKENIKDYIDEFYTKELNFDYKNLKNKERGR